MCSTEAERDEVLAALDQVERELAGGAFAFVPSDEDIHTAVERRVTELAGAAGAKLHTGRSRNDQIATDLRLYTKRALLEVADRVLGLQEVLLDAGRGGRRRLPARATPTCSGRSPSRWPTTCSPTAGPSRATSIGCSTAAAARTSRRWAPARWPGSSIPLDPDGVAADLGFAGPVREQPRRGVATATSWPRRSSRSR